MFGPVHVDNLTQVARFHQEDLLREAEAQRRIRTSGLRVTPVYREAAWRLGAAMVSLGERLSAGYPAASQNCASENCA